MRYLRRGALMLLLLLAAGLAYGPLFAWAPVTPGFSNLRTPHVGIVFRSPPGLSIPAAQIETTIVQLQGQLGLAFRSPARFVLCDDWSDLVRFTPWLRVSHGIGAITLPVGLVTYVTPTGRTRGDLLDFMTHEAAHSLLYQHASIRDRLEMERQAWFVEGVAVHFGNPLAYASPEEFRTMRSAADVSALLDAPEGGNRRAGADARFRYSAYGYFVAYLNARFGTPRFQQFTAEYVQHPASYRADFQRVFGLPFGEAARGFAESIFPPRR